MAARRGLTYTLVSIYSWRSGTRGGTLRGALAAAARRPGSSVAARESPAPRCRHLQRGPAARPARCANVDGTVEAWARTPAASRGFASEADHAAARATRRHATLRRLFNEVDSMGERDGRISVLELSRAVRETMSSQEYAKADVEKMISVADLDGNGTVELDEFMALFGGLGDEDLTLESLARFWLMSSTGTKSKSRSETLRQLFEQFDLLDTADGQISVVELSRMLRSLLPTSTYASADLNHMLNVADSDGSGHVSFREFELLFGGLADDELSLENCALYWLGAADDAGTDSD